jgi:Bifunctional DNA primase/polymerase, N-terminal
LVSCVIVSTGLWRGTENLAQTGRCTRISATWKITPTCRNCKAVCALKGHTNVMPYLLQYAQQLACAGLRVFPIDPVAKRPLISGGFKSASTDPDIIARWWKLFPHALIGIATDRFSVLDVDPPLDESIPALELATGLPWQNIQDRCDLIAQTPRGGFHLYWGRVPDCPVRTAAGDIAKGIDTRGHAADGIPTGYITAPFGPGRSLTKGCIDALLIGALAPPPRQLLYRMAFSSRDRESLRKHPKLISELNAAQASEWAGLISKHQTAQRDAMTARLARSSVDGNGMRRQAMSDLHEAASALAMLADGRKTALFAAGCKLAKYVANAVLTEAEVLIALTDAAQANGLQQSHGCRYVADSVRNGLKRGAADVLPPLARQYRTVGGTAHAA